MLPSTIVALLLAGFVSASPVPPEKRARLAKGKLEVMSGGCLSPSNGNLVRVDCGSAPAAFFDDEKGNLFFGEDVVYIPSRSDGKPVNVANYNDPAADSVLRALGREDRRNGGANPDPRFAHQIVARGYKGPELCLDARDEQVVVRQCSGGYHIPESQTFRFVP